jgi:hypothetical protein
VRVDDDLAALLLDASARLELRVPMRWECRATSVRAHMGVHNSHGLPLILGVQVLTLKPWKLTAYLMIYGQHIRRLDVNGSHRKPDRWSRGVGRAHPQALVLRGAPGRGRVHPG